MGNHPKVFAVVVTYNGMKWLDRCLGSLKKSEAPIYTIVVDNASTDGTPDYIAEHFPKVHLIRSKDNLGFAKANNIGIRYALDNGAEYIFLLNQDAWIENSTIACMIETFGEFDDVGIVSPIHMNGTGDALDWGFCGYVPAEFVSDSYLGKLQDHYICDFVNAAAWLVKRNCIEKVGGFDTSMFTHYGEDTNYCQRLKYHNFRIAINTRCFAFHDRGFRKGNEQEYRNSVFSQTDVNRRLEFANILYDIDVQSFIDQTKKSIKKSYLKLKFVQAKRLEKDLAFYRKVKRSRETNQLGGLNWL